MAYRDTLTALSEGSADRVEAIVTARDDGDFTEGEAAALIAAAVVVANTRAAGLADLSVSADLSVATGRAVPTVGVGLVPGEQSRLRRAGSTLLAALPGTPDKQARTRRLGRSEPLTTAQRARGEALAKQPTVQGWTRRLSAKPCELCVWWWREGRVWPADHTMPTHKGCTCSQTPVLVESVKRVSR